MIDALTPELRERPICREATLVHGPDGTFVGEDELGNRYYENNKNQMGERLHS